MKKIYCFLLFACGIKIALNGQVSFTSSNLPIIIINTNGQTIADDPKITCDMKVIYNGPGIRNNVTDFPNNYNGKIGIEIRGSTSQQYPKKSYGVETRDSAGNNLNVSLLGLPKENDWILYGPYPDKTLMRNEITYYLFGRMGYYSPRTVFCELMINGQYMGNYTLIEKIKIDKNRVNIAKLKPTDTAGDSLTGGYIIKVDKTTGNSNTTWTSPHQSKVKFLYHDPEDADLVQVQKNYIKNYVTSFENTVYGPQWNNPVVGYRKFINTASFIDFYLMQELGRTVDGYRSSSFMYKDKDSKGGKLTAGPMWDFNLSFGNCDYCDAFDTTGWQYNFNSVCSNFSSAVPDWWSKLLLDSVYANEVQCRWKTLRKTMLHTDSVNNWIDSVAMYLDESQKRNFVEWPILGVYVNWNYYIGQTYSDEINYLKWWFLSRSKYMDQHLPGKCTANTGIDEPYETIIVKAYPNPTNSFISFDIISDKNSKKLLSIYDIMGNKIVETTFEGIYVTLKTDLTLFANGLYIYQIYSEKALLKTGKLIKE